MRYLALLPLFVGLAVTASSCSRKTTPVDRERVQAEPKAKPSAEPAMTRPTTPEPEPEPPRPEELSLPKSQRTLPTKIVLVAPYTEAYCEFRLHGPEGAIIGTHCSTVSRFQNDTLTPVELKMSDTHIIDRVLQLRGWWPNSLRGVFVVGERHTSDRGDYYDYNEQLVLGKADALQIDQSPAPSQAWSKGRLLAWRNGALAVVSGSQDGSPPLPSAVHVCAARRWILTFGAHPSGHVIAVTRRCGDEARFDVETWDSAGGEGTLTPLPTRKSFSEKARLRVLMTAKQAFILAADGDVNALWRQTPEGWQEVRLPISPDILAATLANNGDLWLAGDQKNSGELYRLSKDEWTAATPPSEDAIRAAFDASEITHALSLELTSVAESSGQLLLGGTVLKNKSSFGAAVLRLAEETQPAQE